MQVTTHNRVYQRIRKFYDNAMLKYPNSYFPDEADRNVDKVCDEIYKVGTLPKVNPNTSFVPKTWAGYFVSRSDTGWYFAYKIQGNTVYIYDAANHTNMSNQYPSNFKPNHNRTTNKTNNNSQTKNNPIGNTTLDKIIMVILFCVHQMVYITIL